MKPKTLEDIINTDLASVKKAQSLLVIAIFNNNEKFITSIRNNDLNAFDESVAWGITWEDPFFWSSLGRKFSFNKINTDMLDKLARLDIPDIEIKNNSQQTYQSENKNAKKYGKQLFKHTIERALSDSFFNPYLFMWITKKQPSLLTDDILKKQLKNFLTVNLSNPSYSAVHDYMILHHEHLIPDFVSTYSSFQNLQFFQSDSRYKDVFDTVFKREDIRNKMMLNAIANIDIDMIRFLHSHGIDISTTKESYSNLFGNRNVGNKNMKEIIQTIQYVLNNTPDIGVHNHIILRTCLRQNRTDLIKEVVFSYFQSNRLNEIDIHFNGREDNQVKSVAMKEIEYLKFYDNLSASLATQDKNNTFKIHKL